MEDLSSIRPDPKNARRRTQRSAALIERSLSEFGAARSIVVDEDGVILAGNGTVEAAASIGIEKVLVVPADGNTLVAVQRTDLTPAQKAEYGIADNRTSDLSEFDAAVLSELVELHEDLTLDPWFNEAEIADLGKELEELENAAGKQDEQDPTEKLTFTLTFPTSTAQNLFMQSLTQLAAALPESPTSEERLQYVLDQFLSA